MSRLKQLFFRGAGLIPPALLKKLAPSDSLFPYHHVVADEPLEHIRHLYPYKNIKQFNSDLDFLLRHYSPVEPAELFNSLSNTGKLPRGRFLLSFDDGFRETYEIIAPLLKKRGVPAIFFINPAFIGNRVFFYRNKISLLIGQLKKADNTLLKDCALLLNCNNCGLSAIISRLLTMKQSDETLIDSLADRAGISFAGYLKEKRPWLTEEELQSLAADGFSIGAHSWDHPYYKELSTEQQLDQTLRSCEYVKNIDPRKPLCFSFPHTDQPLTGRFFDEIKKLDQGPDILFGIQNQRSEWHNRTIHRFNAERPEYTMKQVANGMLVYGMLQQIRGHQTINRNHA